MSSEVKIINEMIDPESRQALSIPINTFFTGSISNTKGLYLRMSYGVIQIGDKWTIWDERYLSSCRVNDYAKVDVTIETCQVQSFALADAMESENGYTSRIVDEITEYGVKHDVA